ncbi:cytochrome P450 [Pseudonocardia sp.]|uniref:cytochrome P450 n=2 Tax=Pseudonocardia sp. TaxID=60912 RepID=UPI003D148AA1
MTTSLRYDPLDLATIADPYPVYAELRAHDPVHWHEGMRSWVLTRYDDCRDVLRNSDVWARDWRRVGAQVPDERINIQSQDPPEPKKLRGIVIGSLREQQMAEMCRRAGDTLDRILAGRERGAGFDLMAEIAAPLALQITCDLVGVEEPGSYHDIYLGLTRRMDSGLVPEHAEPGLAAGLELVAMMRDWFATTRRPGMISVLRDHPGTDGMADTYVQNTVSAIFNASYSTLFASTGAVVQLLMQRPDVLERLRDPALMATGVDELVRFTAPAQGTSRVATCATAIGGTPMERGDVVITMFAAANRDPARFDRPEELVLHRTPNPHLGFGWGPHICVGARLATVWLHELIGRLHRAPALVPAGEARWMRSATLRNLELLPTAIA